MHICWRLRCSYALLSLWRRRSGTPSVQESEEPAQSITDKLARMDVMTEKRSVLVSMPRAALNCQPLLQRPDFPINGIVALLMDLVRVSIDHQPQCCPDDTLCQWGLLLSSFLQCRHFEVAFAGRPYQKQALAWPGQLLCKGIGLEALQKQLSGPSGCNRAAGEDDAAGGGDQLHAAPRKRAGGATAAKPVRRAQLGLWQGDQRTATPCCRCRHASCPVARFQRHKPL